METKIYSTYTFEEFALWEKVPEARLEFYHWNSQIQYETYFKLCFVKNKGICLQMRTNEKELRIQCRNTDEPVYEDSCMEVFLCAVEGRQEYINIEMNPLGTYLSEFGKGREGRALLKTKTDKVPVITPKKNDSGWSLEVFIPCALISEAYGEKFTADECVIRGNFYKCGDKTAKIHYGAYNEMTTLPPGFHNPERFAEIRVQSFKNK